MFEFLMNNSVLIVFLICAAIIGRSEYKKYLESKNMDSSELRSLLRSKINDVGNELLAKLAVSIIVTLIISLISFRVLWMNDAFHIVFLTNLISKPTWKYLKRIFN